MKIRKADASEVELCASIYETARGFMRANGNHEQWTGGYPSIKDAQQDFDRGNLYVCEEDGQVLACFTFHPGPDPAYAIIEDGSWVNDAPYWVLHRIAVGVQGKGVGTYCLTWLKEHQSNIRADTHELNTAMQAVFKKCGFVRCGIIYTKDGAPRVSFQYVEGTTKGQAA
ncbi:MAG: GNAT family N-acetyltransferase [Atopobiaceae bacterium]